MKKFFLSFIAAVSVFGLLQLASPVVHAQFDSAKSEACAGLGGGDNFVDCSSDSGANGISGVLKVALNLLSLVAGVIAVIMIIISGIKFQTSQGDPGAVATARSTLIYAIVGIVIVVLAQIIVNFVISEVSSAPGSSQEVEEGKDENGNSTEFQSEPGGQVGS